MQLTGELKEKVENKEEAKKTIKDAGMILDDNELNQVNGGDGGTHGGWGHYTSIPVDQITLI